MEGGGVGGGFLGVRDGVGEEFLGLRGEGEVLGVELGEVILFFEGFC